MARKNIKDNSNDSVQPSHTIDISASTVVESDPNPETEATEKPQEDADIQVESNGSNQAALEATIAELRSALSQVNQREAATVSELRSALEKAHQQEESTASELRSALEKAQQREESTVAELRASLEKAHKREYELQENVYQLKSELYEQKTLVQKLEQALDQANLKIKNELDQAKKTALELAEANGKLIEEIQGLKKQDKQEKPTTQPTPQAIVPKKAITIPKKSIPIIEKLPPEKPGEPAKTSSPMWLLD